MARAVRCASAVDRILRARTWQTHSPIDLFITDRELFTFGRRSEQCERPP
jgi:hypothetical protein